MKNPRAALAAMVACGLALSGCGGGGGGDAWQEPEEDAVTVSILEPADGAIDVVTSTGLTVAVDNAADTTVELVDAASNNSVDGELSPEGIWRPAGQLAWDTTYVATLTAVSHTGEPVIATSTFTTMPEPPGTIRVYSFLTSDNEVGVAMPLRLEFVDDDWRPQEIPEEHRAEVERRLQVRTEPEQAGSWHWRSGWELHYRPETYWQPGTQIHYRVTTGGLPVGDGRYLRNDVNVSPLRVGRAVEMSVDNDGRQLTVWENGEVVRTIPVSLGRTEYPSSSGTFPIMEKKEEELFDTFATLGPDHGYRVEVEYAMRLTLGGEYIHADVRDGSDLGNNNVTHGCINMSRDNAEWLFEFTHRWGDPVTIEGTSRSWSPGDGWTDWNLDWEEYQRGSALHQD